MAKEKECSGFSLHSSKGERAGPYRSSRNAKRRALAILRKDKMERWIDINCECCDALVERVRRDRPPNIRIDLSLVEIGYQVDVYVKGKPQEFGSGCRDFSCDVDPEELTNKILRAIAKILEEVDQ